MAILISTQISIDSTIRLKTSSSSVSKKSGVFYPDTLEIKYIDLFTFENKDGEMEDGEMDYIISVNGMATKEGLKSKEIIDLSNLLRAYDFKKYPLQLDCTIFEQGSNWAGEVKQFVSDRNSKTTTTKLNAKELLAKFKK